jgi:hypothetical protein
MKKLLMLALATSFWGCARSYYTYEPRGVAGRSYDGRITAEREVPGGDVRIVPMGLAEVRPQPAGVESFRALHVRMLLENRSDQPWRVRTDEQRAYLERWGVAAPADAAIGSLRVRDVIVPPKQNVALDLFYPLPEPEFGEQMPAGFAIDWRVQTTDGIASQRTRFDRREIDAQTAAARLNRL